MRLINKLLLIIGFIGLFFSCIHKNKPVESKIIGKIINPKKTEIVISKDPFNVESDTLLIKSGNKFKGSIQVKKEGLHYIFIFPEFQMIYLKPGDSLAFVLNTTEFDESLSFSGTSGFENNLMLELFLANEKENMEISSNLIHLTPEQLNKKLDSFFQIKQKLIASYKKSFKKTSKHFRKTVELYNKVAQYRIKENYLSQKRNDSIASSFKTYRNLLKKRLVDPNLPDLLYFSKTYIDNRLREKKVNRKNAAQEAVELINKEIEDPLLRDNVLMIYCKNYLIGQQIHSSNDGTYQKYIQSIKNKAYISDCQDIIKKNNLLKKGNHFPNVLIRDKNSKRYQLSEIFKNKKTLLSFSDLYYKSNYDANMQKLKNIKKHYPNLQIVILNDNPDDFDEWRLQMPHDTSIKFYQLQIPENQAELILPYGLNQVFLLDSTYIKQSLINLYDGHLERRLNTFMKKEKL